MQNIEKEPKMNNELLISSDEIRVQREKSVSEGRLVALGDLRGRTPAEHWTGSISLAKRLESADLSIKEVEDSFKTLPEFFVDSISGRPKRCGDGRTTKGYKPRIPYSQTPGLGVQNFGGTGGDATAKRLKEGYRPGATFGADIKKVIQTHTSDFAPGGHSDDHAHGDSTGCGAIDGQKRKNDILTDDKKSETIRSVLGFIYNSANLDFNNQLFDLATSNAKELSQYSDSYFKDKYTSLDLIEESSLEGVEVLSGTHNEVSLTLNLVENTTFDRDSYNQMSDNKIQNFNIDVWAILKEYGDNAIFVLIDDLATALDLTDGTLKVFARVPAK